MILTIVGQLPSGKNQVQITMRGGRFHKYPNAKFSRWRKDACQQLQGQFHETIAWPVEICVDYTPGDLITRDLPGLQDALFHLFEYAGVIKDDGLIENIGYWRKHPLDRKTPMVRVSLTRLQP